MKIHTVGTIINALHSNKELISALYEKRNRDVTIASILGDDLEISTLALLEENFDFLELHDPYISISDALAVFIDNSLLLSKEIRIGAIRDHLEELSERIDLHQDPKIEDKKSIEKSIRKGMRKIRVEVGKTFSAIKEHIIIEFKSQSDNYRKRKELESYRGKILDLHALENEISDLLKREAFFFQQLPSVEIREEYHTLDTTLSGIKSSITTLQLEVTEYIHKLSGNREDVKRILSLSELIRNREFTEKTNILEVLEEKIFTLASLEPVRMPLFVSDENIEYEEGFVENIAEIYKDRDFMYLPTEGEAKDSAEREPLSDDVLHTETVSKENYVSAEMVFSAFERQKHDLDLYAFIASLRITSTLNVFEKITIYKSVLSSHDRELKIFDEEITTEEHIRIKKIYLNKRRQK